jgi:hypothetical protein
MRIDRIEIELTDRETDEDTIRRALGDLARRLAQHPPPDVPPTLRVGPVAADRLADELYRRLA